MHLLWSAFGSHGSHGSCVDVEPMAGPAARLRSLGAEVPVCAPPDFAALFDTVAAAAEGSDALVTTSVMPSGGWL